MVLELLIVVASLVVEHGFKGMLASVLVPHGLESTSSAVVVHGISRFTACGTLLPGPGIEPCPLH